MSIRTTNFDALAAAAPLDRQASVIRDGSGDLWEAKIADTVPRWDHPPPMKAVAGLVPAHQIEVAKLVGRRFGRMVVFGILEGGNPKKGATWVCRCDCSYYEGRKAKALMNPKADEHMCFACKKVEYLRSQALKPNTGAGRKASETMLDRMAGASR